MPQLNSDEAANDEPTAYNVEGEEDNRWGEDDHLNDIKGDLLNDIDKDPRSSGNSKSISNGESSNKDRLDRDPREEVKGPGRPSGYLYPPDIGSIVSGLHPSIFPNGGLPPNSKVPYPYSMPYGAIFYGASPSSPDSKTGMPRSHHPDIPSMYSLPGQLGQIPHPLAPWPAPPLYPICTASTMASIMSRYPHPFAPFASTAAAALAPASNMPRFPLGHGPPHAPGMHPTMIPHPGLISNGLGSMGNSQHHHGKHDGEKQGGRSKSEGQSKRERPYVKKPLNAFMLYMKEQRAKVVAECTLKESAAINQILGRKWHSLSREEQQKYYEMARKERQLHLQLYPGWSARDNYGKRKKRKKEKNQGECTDSSRERSYASFASDHFYSPNPPHGSSSSLFYQFGGDRAHYSPPCHYGNQNNNNNKETSLHDFAQMDSASFWGRQIGDSANLRNNDSADSPEYHKRRKKKCIRYQHDDDSDEDDSPQHSPQFAGFQGGRYDSVRSTTPPSMMSQSMSVTNGEHGPGSRLSGSQISPRQPLQVNDIKQEMRTSPLTMDGPPTMVNNGKSFDPTFTSRHPRRAPSSDISSKSEGSPNSQGGDSNHGNHRHANENNNNNDILDGNLSMIGEGDPSVSSCDLTVPSGGSNLRKTNSIDGDMPGPSGLGRSRMLNTSGNSNNSADSPGSKSHPHRKSNGPSTSHHLPHPSPLHTPSTGLFLPPQTGGSPMLSPSYTHPSPHGSFMPPYSPYLTQASMLAAAFAPPSPLGGLIGLSQFKGINPSSIGGGGPNPGPSGGHSSSTRLTPGTIVEGKS